MSTDTELKPVKGEYIQGEPIWLSEDELKRRIKEDRLKSEIGVAGIFLTKADIDCIWQRMIGI